MLSLVRTLSMQRTRSNKPLRACQEGELTCIILMCPACIYPMYIVNTNERWRQFYKCNNQSTVTKHSPSQFMRVGSTCTEHDIGAQHIPFVCHEIVASRFAVLLFISPLDTIFANFSKATMCCLFNRISGRPEMKRATIAFTDVVHGRDKVSQVFF